jgi:hypothetical protein
VKGLDLKIFEGWFPLLGLLLFLLLAAAATAAAAALLSGHEAVTAVPAYKSL